MIGLFSLSWDQSFEKDDCFVVTKEAPDLKQKCDQKYKTLMHDHKLNNLITLDIPESIQDLNFPCLKSIIFLSTFRDQF